ncbi:MAG: single-stranded DNA-binding protein, partial [Lentisphaerae bacterium]|nr:single-stranded DNA-binding protein [Lentisphaerota bacterium]
MEVRHTPNGKSIGEVSVACMSGYGEHEKTSWIRCKLFGDRAVKLSEYLTKG